MLTNQHRFVARMINCRERTDYKLHMCGVCHALGDDYGMVSRLITNHEIILLNMLTEAQCETPSDVVLRRCPLNPTHHVRTNQTVSSRFAAAIAVLLVNTGIEDDLRDGKGLQLPTRLLKAMSSRFANTARETLSALQFDTAQLLSLQDKQSHAEATNGDPLAPSRDSSATIFSMTGHLAGQPLNQPALATIGANYGAYLYLLDAVKDYAGDYEKGQYNPLLPYTIVGNGVLTLSQDGVNWLRDEFNAILSAIRTELAGLKLYQYQTAIQTMLTEPIERITTRLQAVTDGLHYAQVGRWDALKSLILMSEQKPEGESVDDFFADDNSPNAESGKKKKRRGKKNNNSDDSDSGCDGDDCSGCFWGPYYGSSPCDCCTDYNCNGIPDSLECCASIGGNGCGEGLGEGCGSGCGEGCGSGCGDGCDIGGCDGGCGN